VLQHPRKTEGRSNGPDSNEGNANSVVHGYRSNDRARCADAPVPDGGVRRMSVEAGGQTVSASDHAVQRFVQRTGQAFVTQTDIEYRFREGYRVDVEDKSYAEARLVTVDGTALVLLRKGPAITTVVYARGEEVTFQQESPVVECRDCGVVYDDPTDLGTCQHCGAQDVHVGGGSD
jgi:hypothetical protein